MGTANRLLYFIRQVSAKAMTDIRSVMAATINADRVNLFTRFTPIGYYQPWRLSSSLDLISRCNGQYSLSVSP
jgi:hypothetical protein